MRQDSVIVISKGTAHFIVGIFTPWTAALAQWIGSGEWPSGIVWLGVIAPASAIGGASALLSFLSGAYSDYLKDKEPRQALADAAEAKLQTVKEQAKVAELQKTIEEAKT